MPELIFKGKEFVYNHHLAVPFRPLVPHADKSIGDARLDGNLIIHGDNLHALKSLLPLYAGKVDCIFIDPPYNTGNEGWNYNDNVNSPMIREWLSNNPVGIDDGLRHDKWCSMMWPRLRLLHELLADKGVLFAAIDDCEDHSLRCILQEVFGADNFVGQIVWEKGKKGDAKLLAETHEYILVFAKDKARLLADGIRWRRPKEGAEEVLAYYDQLRTEHGSEHARIRELMMEWFRGLPDSDPRKAHKHYNWSDDRGLYFPDNFHGPDDGRVNRPRYDIMHPITGRSCAKPSTGWRWDEETTRAALAENPPRIHFGLDETTIPCRKTYLTEVDREPFSTVIYKDGRAATLQVENILGRGAFQFPKDVEIVRDLITMVAGPDALILDSFAGSGTTGHAVLNANRRDGGKRRFILVECEDYADTKTAERVRRIINGYAYSGVQREELLRERLTFSDLRSSQRILELVSSIENLEGGRFDRISKTIKDRDLVVVGEKYVQQQTEGLGGEFTFCTLGEAIALDRLLTGEALPSFESLGSVLFHMATNQAFDPAQMSEQDGLGYLGESPAYHVWLIYKPDLDFLKSRDAALTLAKAKALVEVKSGKRHLVFAPARFVSQKMLNDENLPVEFAPLPFALYRIERG